LSSSRANSRDAKLHHRALLL